MKMLQRILRDMAAGIMVAMIPLFQQGMSGGFKSATFIAGAVIALLGLLKAAIDKEWVPGNTGIVGMARDFVLALILAAQPIVQSGIVDGQSFMVILGAIGIMAFSVAANVIKVDMPVGSQWSYVLRDFFSGGLLAAQAVIQTGIAAGQSWKFIAVGVFVSLVSLFSHELKEHFGIGDGK